MSSPDVDQEYLEKIKQEHMELGRQVSAFRRLVAERGPIDALQKIINELKGELKEHFELEEHGGYFSEAVAHAPRLQTQAGRLLDEHGQMLEQIEVLSSAVGSSQANDEAWSAFSQIANEFIKTLTSHERAENSLLQEAYERDIGDKD